MQRRHSAAVCGLALAAGLVTGATGLAAPARADTAADAFLAAITAAGLNTADRADPIALGQSVCPMLAEPGQNAANVAAKVADTAGMPLGPATMFTGIAISMFCPAMVAAVGNGTPPIPLDVLGF